MHLHQPDPYGYVDSPKFTATRMSLRKEELSIAIPDGSARCHAYTYSVPDTLAIAAIAAASHESAAARRMPPLAAGFRNVERALAVASAGITVAILAGAVIVGSAAPPAAMPGVASVFVAAGDTAVSAGAGAASVNVAPAAVAVGLGSEDVSGPPPWRTKAVAVPSSCGVIGKPRSPVQNAKPVVMVHEMSNVPKSMRASDGPSMSVAASVNDGAGTTPVCVPGRIAHVVRLANSSTPSTPALSGSSLKPGTNSVTSART